MLKWLFLLMLLALGAIGYSVFFTTPQMQRSSTTATHSTQNTPLLEDLKAKADAEALAKSQEEDRKAQAEATRIESEKALKDAEAKKQLAGKQQVLDTIKGQIAEKMAILNALAQKPVEDAATGDDKLKAKDLKSQKTQAAEKYLAIKEKSLNATNAARSASNDINGSRKKSEYKGWCYVGSSELHSMSELANRDKKRRIEYVSGGKETQDDRVEDQAKQAAKSASDELKTAINAKESAEKAYDAFALNYKSRIQKELADLKARQTSLGQEFAVAQPSPK